MISQPQAVTDVIRQAIDAVTHSQPSRNTGALPDAFRQEL
jgi:hypothetical protein